MNRRARVTAAVAAVIRLTRATPIARKSLGWTGFHWACIKGLFRIAEVLMTNSCELKIDLNAKINDGRSGFHLACWNGHSEIGDILMRNSAAFRSVNFRSKFSYSHLNKNKTKKDLVLDRSKGY